MLAEDKQDGIAKKNSNIDLLAPYRHNGCEAKHQLMSTEGGSYKSEEVITILGIGETDLVEMRQNSKIIGFPLEDGSYIYPKWQFVKSWFFHHRIITGLERVLLALPDSNPWGQASFLLNKLVSTEVSTPLEGLRQGRVDLVVSIAKSLGEQGAS